MKQLILIFALVGTCFALDAQTVTTIDFTDPATPTWGTNAQINVGGVMMLKPGDANGDKKVIYIGTANDVTSVANTVGVFTPSLIISGYHQSDVNMDGQVIYIGTANDVTTIANTVGVFTPSLIIEEQIP